MHRKKPLSITVICILGFLGGAFALPLIYSSPRGNNTYLSISTLVGIICMFGLWYMRRWAVYVYTTMAIINQFILFYEGRWQAFFMLIPGLFIFIGFTHLEEMH